MTPDPLDALRIPVIPIEPRPEFADALLRRIEDSPHPVAASRTTPTVRYFVNDLDTAIAFYCRQLDFEEELRPSPTFAMLYRNDLRLLLSVPGGAHVMPDGTLPEPGGWNRMALQVEDLGRIVDALRDNDAHFRTDIVTGVGVRQILLEDPSGNLVELFEPTAGYHERPRPPELTPRPGQEKRP
jgi:catechol 2,3-dioxygenase-like lactoylglutathione lyase family enzyme